MNQQEQIIWDQYLANCKIRMQVHDAQNVSVRRKEWGEGYYKFGKPRKRRRGLSILSIPAHDEE